MSKESRGDVDQAEANRLLFEAMDHGVRITELIVRRRQPDVAITGYGREGDKDLAREAGFDAHLTKPIAFEELETVMASLLRARPVLP